VFVSLVAVAAFGVWAPPAWGAFPGRDGDLVVATGNGLELVAPGTGAASSICTDVALCGQPAQPSVSPNGRAIAFVDTVSRRPVVIAADGSCLWCLLGAPLTTLTGSEPAFTPGGQGVTVVGNALWSVSLTGGRARRLRQGRVDGAVWSSRGLVAVVRGGWIWVGRPGHGKQRRLARGRSPSFSPNGASVAFAYRGHVWIVRVADASERRLVRGGGPAWSPDGLQIAYIASGGAVEIVAVRGGRPRRVGAVSGTALDWQPLPSSRGHVCKPPARATVLASTPEAVVFSQGGARVFGCLKALGVTRLLLDTNTQSAFGGTLTAVRLAGRFAALVSEYSNRYANWEDETLYDLSSGKATLLAQVTWDCNYGCPPSSNIDGLDSLALDSSGFAAWRETSEPIPAVLTALSCPSASLCVAGDNAGNILTSSDPVADPGAWSIAAADQGQGIVGVSCPSVSMCVAADGAGNIFVSTDPTGGESAWRKTKIAGSGVLESVSCASITLCVAVGDGPIMFTSSDPGGGASAWSSARVGSGGDTAKAVSCPSVSLCVATVATQNPGGVVTSTDPTGGARAWKTALVDQGIPPAGANWPDAVSCPSVSMCVAGDEAGNILTSTDPSGGARAWRKAKLAEPVDALTAVSCPSVSMCVAGDASGNIVTSTDPTGGKRAWREAPADRRGFPAPAIGAVACPSVSLCVAGDTNGDVLTSTDPTGGAKAWSSATVDVPGCPQPSTPCTSERLLVRDDHGTKVVDTAPPGHGNSIGNVALASLVLSWTHDGAQRQLQLR
jgi:hypothetical protein